ncbi:SDR family NAD(P)-dependent oxidoreductase [Solitalea lacus]|uniref:SDR family NAD(P)-dependent oxidoreductase n=1 Tax=Solitalea lacus TaxID=2911172 RepID=UPI001EDA00F9|nr:glucose 1-dehydrogenase [Solitalea lacus]UKJ07939.1 glucose 1-dehydrogenase [Solitalea lacus]
MTINPFDLTGKLALITGGGTGLGIGMAQAMCNAGAKVIITGRREPVLLEAVKELGENAQYIVHDINELNTIPALVDRVEQAYGPIDIVINNAGINMKKPAIEVTDEDFNQIIHTNLNAVFALTRECAKRMLPRKQGSIIMISSMTAMYGIDRVAPYSASKSAVKGMIMGLASEFSPFGVRINAIAPGFIESPMMLKAMDGDPQRKAKVLGRTPMAAFGKAEDIGHTAVYLASNAARFVTGVTIPVDGGNSIGF